MLKGIGIDIIEIDRVKEAVDKYGGSFLDRVYTAGEIRYCRKQQRLGYQELATRFAAKEAYAKATGTGLAGFGKGAGLKFTDVEVVNNPAGKPQLAINGQIIKNAYVSLSHCRDYAVASVYVAE